MATSFVRPYKDPRYTELHLPIEVDESTEYTTYQRVTPVETGGGTYYNQTVSREIRAEYQPPQNLKIQQDKCFASITGYYIQDLAGTPANFTADQAGRPWNPAYEFSSGTLEVNDAVMQQHQLNMEQVTQMNFLMHYTKDQLEEMHETIYTPVFSVDDATSGINTNDTVDTTTTFSEVSQARLTRWLPDYTKPIRKNVPLKDIFSFFDQTGLSGNIKKIVMRLTVKSAQDICYQFAALGVTTGFYITAIEFWFSLAQLTPSQAIKKDAVERFEFQHIDVVKASYTVGSPVNLINRPNVQSVIFGYNANDHTSTNVNKGQFIPPATSVGGTLAAAVRYGDAITPRTDVFRLWNNTNQDEYSAQGYMLLKEVLGAISPSMYTIPYTNYKVTMFYPGTRIFGSAAPRVVGTKDLVLELQGGESKTITAFIIQHRFKEIFPDGRVA